MRTFSCYYYKMREDGILIQNTNSACWAGLNGTSRTWYIPEKKVENGSMGYEYGKDIKFDLENKDYIFIDRWKEADQSMKNIRRLLSIINRITYCKIVKIDNKKYIKYKCIEYHYANLVLLNFIRNCWHIPPSFKYEQFFKDIFKNIRGQEPLVFLMTCLKNNVEQEGDSSYHYGNHSNVYSGIIPKPKERLFAWKEPSMERFLKAK